MKEAIEYLLRSAHPPGSKLSIDNLFREIGFDGNNPRLGWVIPPSWEMIENVLKSLGEAIKEKEVFIFIGMGGSINGIKSLLPLRKGYPLYFLDSLDPQAIKEIIAKIENKKNKVLVIPISKSGSTLETHLLANTFKELFPNNWREHFLWLTDKESFPKLDSSGWEGVKRFTIQINGKSDIGGRFSCPHTLIFLFPLFLLMDRDLVKLKKVFGEYSLLREKIISKAYDLAYSYRGTKEAFFSVIVDKIDTEGFTTWTTQLLQESLGGKREDLAVKTMVGRKCLEGFYPVYLDLEIDNPFVYLMAQMHFLQFFVAFYAYFKKLNFVNQPFVEEYKRLMHELENKKINLPPRIDLDKLIKEITASLKPSLKFIEVVLYLYPQKKLITELKSKLSHNFPEHKSFVFLGSDWNHHSYQSAFLDNTTLYVILLKNEYLEDVPPLKRETIRTDIDTLKVISFATYKTISHKTLYFAI